MVIFGWILKIGQSLLTQTLTGHIDSTDPVLLWNSRVTREGYHSVPAAISKESAINSTAITQQPPEHSTPTSPIQILSQSHKG